jgi:N-terminal acetyltransferase B complex catalytic subunit
MSVAVMGKVEGQGESWHGHVTAVSAATEFRRQKLAKKLMNLLEEISDKM